MLSRTDPDYWAHCKIVLEDHMMYISLRGVYFFFAVFINLEACNMLVKVNRC